MRWGRVLTALLVVVCLTLLAGMLVVDVRPWSGPVLFTITDEHGVHEGDLAVFAVWLVGTTGCAFLGRRR